MIILKHVEYEITDATQSENPEAHLKQTTAEVEGVSYKDIYCI